MARPTRLTPVVQQRILAALRLGAHRTVAARSAGISPDTLGEWLARGAGTSGRPGSELYAQFARAVHEAEAQAELEAIADLRALVKRDHRAALAFLERRFGDRWRSDAEVTPSPLVSVTAHQNTLSLDLATYRQIAKTVIAERRIGRSRDTAGDLDGLVEDA